MLKNQLSPPTKKFLRGNFFQRKITSQKINRRCKFTLENLLRTILPEKLSLTYCHSIRVAFHFISGNFYGQAKNPSIWKIVPRNPPTPNGKFLPQKNFFQEVLPSLYPLLLTTYFLLTRLNRERKGKSDLPLKINCHC